MTRKKEDMIPPSQFLVDALNDLSGQQQEMIKQCGQANADIKAAERHLKDMKLTRSFSSSFNGDTHMRWNQTEKRIQVEVDHEDGKDLVWKNLLECDLETRMKAYNHLVGLLDVIKEGLINETK